jgi:hypothetical protein
MRCMSPLLAQSGHWLVRGACLLMTQSGHWGSPDRIDQFREDVDSHLEGREAGPLVHSLAVSLPTDDYFLAIRQI